MSKGDGINEEVSNLNLLPSVEVITYDASTTFTAGNKIKANTTIKVK